ncbi:RHOMBOID-like protein 8 isoform X2 [Durio zibethinus]|uniref:RHOMBOID-like protein n=1 Tax=Durio zibethinus TaxID=66656 RepID=A0A6P6B5Y6_DURZI|nr:RHOMBOID-like protein 8 isoform X2 [Durio zibethinus]
MEEETPANKLHTQIEIKPQGQEPAPSSCFNNPENNNHPEGKFPFFKSRYRQRASDTWLISFFVILHLLAFITTTLFNYLPLGSVFFQPLSENPLLGPSASTLDKVGALRRAFLAQNHQTWRLFVCPWLHAGLIHFAINISCMIFVGIHLERDYGPLRIGVIYLLSAFFGSLVCSLFVRNSPVVASSGSLFGLLGAMLSGLVRNWKVYSSKCAALAVLFTVFAINFLLGLLPYIDNFANTGAFISGLLLGFVLLCTPQVRQMSKNKAGLFEYGVKSSIKLKLDRPILRSVYLLLFLILLVGCLVAVLLGIDINHYCGWCRFVDCIPCKMWNCNDRTNACEGLPFHQHFTSKDNRLVRHDMLMNSKEVPTKYGLN